MHERRLFQDIDRQGDFLPEQSRPKETLVPSFKVLTISGKSGTGKTVSGELLAEKLGMTYVKIGETFRQRMLATRGITVFGHTERGAGEDRKLDNFTTALVQNPDIYLASQGITGSNGIIIEGRLAGFMATDAMVQPKNTGSEIPFVVRVDFTASDQTRFGRIHKRHPEETYENVARETQQRDEGNLDLWRKAHAPKLNDIDPLDPHAVYRGKPIYDIIADTENRLVPEVVEDIIKQLEEKRLVKRESVEPNKQLPPQGIIFQNP